MLEHTLKVWVMNEFVARCLCYCGLFVLLGGGALVGVSYLPLISRLEAEAADDWFPALCSVTNATVQPAEDGSSARALFAVSLASLTNRVYSNVGRGAGRVGCRSLCPVGGV